MKELADLLEDIGVVCGPCPPKKQATGKCFVAVVPAWLGNGGRESLGNLGQRGGAIPRVQSHADEERRRGGGPGAAEHAWVHPQRLWFRMDQGTGACVQGWLLREAAELARWGVRVGGDVRLALPEQGVNGWGRVEALEDHPEIAPGPGRVVTGWFRHELGVVGDLGIEGEAEPLGVTAGHPFWSCDRHGWVPVGELREGERLRAADGSRPRVLSLTPRREPEPVYNIEVEGDHCYRVGQQGLLVHNSSAGAAGQATDAECDPCKTAVRRTARLTRGGRVYETEFDAVPGTAGDTNPQVCRVHKIIGPVIATDRGNEAEDRAARRAFNAFLLDAINKALGGGYDPGHLIGGTLGGVHDTRNLVPQLASTNKNRTGAGWFPMEKWIRNCLTAGKGTITAAVMQVKVTYPKQATPNIAKYVPERFDVEVSFITKKNPQGKPHQFSLTQTSSFTPPASCYQPSL
jgi:hypothetical protein